MKKNTEAISVAGIGLLAALADRTLAQEERDILTELLEKVPSPQREALFRDSLNGDIDLQENVLHLPSKGRKELLLLVERILHSDGKLTKEEIRFLNRLLNAIAFAGVVDKYSNEKQLLC